MVEIRPGRPEEIACEKELWKLAFGDDDEYIDYFYRRGEDSQVLVLLEDGVVRTMVALFPVELSLPGGGKASSSYIYALATHPEARKKGFGRSILRYVDYYLQEHGRDCVTIVPAEASLHKFFETVDFSECFSTRKMELLRPMIGAPAPGDRLEPCAPADYEALREALLAGTFHVSYGERLITYQQGLSQMARGDLYRLTVDGVEGVAAAEHLDEESIMVKELVIPTAQMRGAMALLAQRLPARRYHLRTPPFWDGVSGSYLQSFAMIKWFDKDMERAWRETRRGYMGLGFD